LPPPEEDEFYLADLIGLRVERQDGATLGTIRAVPDYGGGPMLVIAGTDGHELLVPFTLAAVPVVDLPAGRVVVDPPQEVAGEEGEREAVLEETREGGSS
jgi:16S rRNA processing protein RimM